MDEIIIYTDGSCDNKTGLGGWAFALDKKEYGNGYEKDTTNNRMEMKAVIEAIAYAKHEFPNQDIIIYSDSQYVVKGFSNWMFSWKRKGWKKSSGTLLNIDLWKILYENRDDIELRWVKGHNGNEMNEFVDELASIKNIDKDNSIRLGFSVKTDKGLKEQYNKICQGYIDAFCKKQETYFDGWVADIVGDVAYIGDCTFAFRDIVWDIDTGQRKELIFEWYYGSIDNPCNKINYFTFTKIKMFE